jgi:hypothetical protein
VSRLVGSEMCIRDRINSEYFLLHENSRLGN